MPKYIWIASHDLFFKKVILKWHLVLYKILIENDKFIQSISCLIWTLNASILNKNKQKCNKIEDENVNYLMYRKHINFWKLLKNMIY